MKRVLILFLLVGISHFAWSQVTSCAQTLRLAQSIYEQGRLHELEDIINKGLVQQDCDQQTKVSLIKLLTQAYIYLEEPEKANKSMLQLLETDHYFAVNTEIDPAEFIALYRTFRTRPIYRIGAMLGANASQPNVVYSETAAQLADGSKYSYGISLLFGAAADVPFNNPDMTLHADLLFMQKKFSVTQIRDRGFSEEGVALFNELQGSESQSWLSLPVTFQYRLADKKYNPYVAGGASFDYLLSDELNGQVLRTGETSIQEARYDFINNRSKINASAIIAAGVKVAMGTGYFVAEVRYSYGITSVNSTESAFANEKANWLLPYADPVFKVSSLALSGSYIFNVFKPKKMNVK